MTKLERYIALREDGYTVTEIAEMCGCSHQNVSQMLSRRNVAIFRKLSKEQVVFDGLRKWMNDNKVSARELYRRMNNKNAIGVSARCYYEKLKGERRLWMDEINEIIRVTGLSYEVLFLEGEEE